jgi:SPP1 gp7 family putative phage head morphogenesis protein
MDDLELMFRMNPKESIEYIKNLGIKVSWDWESTLEAIQEGAFTVSKVNNANLLQDVKNSLEKSLEQGTSYNDFKKDIKPLLIRRGFERKPDGSSWRFDTIYRTNVQSAYMNSKLEQLEEVKQTFEYWQYDSISDSRTRPSHKALDGKILRADDPFWKTHFPPNGFNCRCSIIPIRKTEIIKRNLNVSKANSLIKYAPDDGFASKRGKKVEIDYSKYSPEIQAKLKK